MPDKTEIPSYGAVVIEKTPAGFMVLVVGGYHGWSFPKGHQEANETPVETARREVLEETGIDVVIDSSFFRTVASALPQDNRTVTFFLGHCPEGTPEPIAQSEEVEKAAWIPVGEALKGITYAPDRRVLQETLTYLGIGSADPAAY